MGERRREARVVPVLSWYVPVSRVRSAGSNSPGNTLIWLIRQRMECVSSSDCFDHGDCQNSHCNCDFGWFDDLCDRPGTTIWGDCWEAFLVIFTVLFTCLLSLSAFQLYISIRANNWMIGWIRRLLGSPKHLAILFIITQAVLRVVWLLTDPLRLKNRVNRVFDRIIFESAYPLIYSTFSCVLLVWGGLYQGVARLKSDTTRLFRWVLFTAMILSFPVCFVVSTIKGMRVNQQEFRIVGYGLICLGVIIIMTGLLMFGRKLMNIAKELEETGSEQGLLVGTTTKGTKTPGDLTTFNLDVPSLIKEHVEEEPLDAPSIMSIEAAYHLRPSMQFSLANSAIEVDSEAWSLSSASQIEHGGSDGGWSFVTTGNIVVPEVKLGNGPISARMKRVEEYLVVLTDEDQAVLKQVRGIQVVIMTSLSAVVGGAAIVISVLFALVPASSKQPWLVLTFLCLNLVLELLASGLVLLVFTTTIRVKEKESLQFLAKLAETRKLTHLGLPQEFPHIAKRLLKYFGSRQADITRTHIP